MPWFHATFFHRVTLRPAEPHVFGEELEDMTDLLP